MCNRKGILFPADGCGPFCFFLRRVLVIPEISGKGKDPSVSLFQDSPSNARRNTFTTNKCCRYWRFPLPPSLLCPFALGRTKKYRRNGGTKRTTDAAASSLFFIRPSFLFLPHQLGSSSFSFVSILFHLTRSLLPLLSSTYAPSLACTQEEKIFFPFSPGTHSTVQCVSFPYNARWVPVREIPFWVTAWSERKDWVLH